MSPCSVASSADTGWNIELAPDPDAVLGAYPGPIVTSDSVVLDRGRPWINLAAQVIDRRAPRAWPIDLRGGPNRAC